MLCACYEPSIGLSFDKCASWMFSAGRGSVGRVDRYSVGTSSEEVDSASNRFCVSAYVMPSPTPTDNPTTPARTIFDLARTNPTPNPARSPYPILFNPFSTDSSNKSDSCDSDMTQAYHNPTQIPQKQ
mmetsp:Transcript_7788/g.11544  ORF Transcript_7788/g.11544 Transcript_7788/m.11544 type:complete len:128 (-) Transcript_7788:192-575(-)